MRKYTEYNLAYLAGILDGEGTISMGDKRPTRRGTIKKTKATCRNRINFSTQVSVCNTDKRLMDWLVEHFGGSISYTKRQKSHWATKMTWIMPTIEISKILKGTLQFLVLKHEQARLMIEARKSFDANTKNLPVSDKIYNRRLEIAKLIREHNQYVLPPCCPSVSSS